MYDAKQNNYGNLKADSAVSYCWYIWQKGFKGSQELKWFN